MRNSVARNIRKLIDNSSNDATAALKAKNQDYIHLLQLQTLYT